MFTLFRVFRIDIRVHWSFFLLPGFFAYHYYAAAGPEAAVRVTAVILMIFAFVVGHELSHSLVARRYGIDVPDITLYPIGGVANMRRIPRDPAQEFWISIAGPLFNFAAFGVLFLPLYFWLGRDALFHPGLQSWPHAVSNAYWANPVLGVFNLIPAFPMDGGRILRAALSKPFGRVKATRISVSIGHIFAILFFSLGALQKNWTLLLIGLFVFSAATNEKRQVLNEEKYLLEIEELKKRLRETHDHEPR